MGAERQKAIRPVRSINRSFRQIERQFDNKTKQGENVIPVALLYDH